MTIMTQLKSCTFNCRGWNNGVHTLKHFIDSLDLCFVQEHWLLSDHLHKINDISSNFLSVSVSGMINSEFVCGRPFGGCSILYRKSLAAHIVPLESCSNRFCGVKFRDSTGLSFLFVCVYMPSSSCPSSYTEYLNTLGELEGFIYSHHCDVVAVVGDFNVDFDRCNPRAKLLDDFMSDHSLCSCDLPFRDDVMFTYERDDGLNRSWIDHVLCSQSFSTLFTNIHAVHSGAILSDHYPLFFSIKADLLSIRAAPSVSSKRLRRTDWSKVTSCDIEKYCSMVSRRLSPLPADALDCTLPDCSIHHGVLDSYGMHLVSTLLTCALDCFPTRSVSATRKGLVGWSQSVSRLRDSSVFWYKVWEEAGCPSSGVLSQIKKNSKKRYKYEARRVIRRQNAFLQRKFANSFAKKKKSSFWADVRKLTTSSSSSSPIVDGVAGSRNIANVFACNLRSILNTHSPSSHISLQSSIQSAVDESDISGVDFTEDDVLEALSHLKTGKSDGDGIFAEHFIYATSALLSPLANFFCSLIRHGFMPQCLRDCVLVPVPKKGKNVACSSSYRPIALASTLSKVLEHVILTKYSPFLCSNPLQFGFKPGFSTTLCTGVIKNVISHYIHNGSRVHGCFLDASKAFDLVDHSLLFAKLIDRGLPLPVVRFLSFWYSSQKMKVRWEKSLSDPFHVSNGVRQGGVLSPVLFSVYLDGLLQKLADSGVGCHWGNLFAGAVCYADDIVLLAPCPSALRILLDICSSYADTHGLQFNAEKTQLICFHLRHTRVYLPDINFNNVVLHYSKEVTHLGHILSSDLDDRSDIIRAVKDLNRKANSLFCTFHVVDPFVKCFLFKSYCLYLYGCSLWSLSSSSLKLIEVALNKLLRKLFYFPRNSHSAIVHCVAHVDSISSFVLSRFLSLLSTALSSPSLLVQSVFSVSSQVVYSFTGYNNIYGSRHSSDYSSQDFSIAHFIRQIRLLYGYHSPYENLIYYLSCA